MGTRITLRVWVPVVLIAFALAFAGCNSKSKVDTTPTSATINVTASPSSLNTGGTAVVEATVPHKNLAIV